MILICILIILVGIVGIYTKSSNAYKNLLGDYALAVAANANGSATVTLHSTIDFIKSAKEGTLVAVATPIKTGRTISRYKVEITLEETSQLIAVLNATSYTLG